MKVIIKTREYGPLTFSCPDEGGYVWVYGIHNNDIPKQPCAGGGFLGSTLISGAGSLRRKAYAWVRQRRALERR